MPHISWSSSPGGTELKKQNVLGKFPAAARTKHLSLLWLLLQSPGGSQLHEWGMLLLSLLFAWIDTNIMKEILHCHALFLSLEGDCAAIISQLSPGGLVTVVSPF